MASLLAAHLFLCWAAFVRRVCVSFARRGSLALIPSACVPLEMEPLGELLSGGGFARESRRRRRDQKYKQRHLAVVEAREELDAERRAHGDERADEVDRESKGRAVVRDVLGQAVPVVLAAPAHGQAADGAAGT